jgi:hypothetical protein
VALIRRWRRWFAGKKKCTKRDVFLAEMAAVVPWAVLESLIKLH